MKNLEQVKSHIEQIAVQITEAKECIKDLEAWDLVGEEEDLFVESLEINLLNIDCTVTNLQQLLGEKSVN
jgi:hypothetical protein